MYEVYPDDKDQWLLYKMGGGDQLVIGTFSEKEDAEFAKQAFFVRDHPVLVDTILDAGYYRATHAGSTIMFPDESDTPFIVE